MAATSAPLSSDEKYDETEQLLHAVIAVFKEKGDVASVKESGNTLRELNAMTEQKHKEMLESVKELSSQVGRAKSEHLERESVMLDPTQKQHLLQERTRVEENIKRLTLETDGLKQRIEKAEGKAAELSAQEQQLRQQEAQEIKRARHTISLYANISSIRWDFGSPAIKGWITSSSGNGMKAFEMDANHNHTDFAVTNYLWELMDAC